MTKYSPIGPIAVLEELEEKALLDDYLLLLAHDVLAEPSRYDDMIARWRYHHQAGSTIIMDNGVIERGAPVPLQDLLEASNWVGADVVVGPDVVGDFQATQKLMIEQGDLIRQDFQMMLIPQGETLEEACECVRWMDEKYATAGPQWWGIPRWMANKFGSRAGVINYINNYARGSGDIRIHLLGMSENFEDDIQCSRTLSVIGIDSANPLVLGWYHEALADPAHPPHMERGNYWECTELHPIMIDNVQWMHNAIARA